MLVGINAGGLMGGETDAVIRQFLKQTRVTFPIAKDQNGSYFSFRPPGGISPFPLEVVIDREGNIAYLQAEYDNTELRGVLEKLLPKN